VLAVLMTAAIMAISRRLLRVGTVFKQQPIGADAHQNNKFADFSYGYFKGVIVSCNLAMKVQTPLKFRAFAAKELFPNRWSSYLAHRGLVSIGQSSVAIHTNDPRFLEWTRSGALNSQLYLMLCDSESGWTPTVGIEKIGLVMGEFSWPKGERAYLKGLTSHLLREPHLAEKYRGAFVEFINKVLDWRVTLSSVTNKEL